MTDFLYLIPALFTGLALGGLFFGGLWWTVKKGLTAAMPGLWFFPSFIIRMTVTAIGFYLIADGSWQKFLACLAGFLISRFLLLRYTRWLTQNAVQAVEESQNAP